MPLRRDELVQRVEEALEEGLCHPHQPALEGIDGALDLHELAIFVVDYVRQPHPAAHGMDRQQVIAQRLEEL